MFELKRNRVVNKQVGYDYGYHLISNKVRRKEAHGKLIQHRIYAFFSFFFYIPGNFTILMTNVFERSTLHSHKRVKSAHKLIMFYVKT